MKIKEIISKLEEFAPPTIAEEWDNVGLMLGDVEGECKGIMLALDLTKDVARQAKEEGCNLILTHHPFIRNGLKSIDLATSKGSCIAELIKSDITVYSMHTNLDKAARGLNYTLASMLGKNVILDGVGAIFDVDDISVCDFAKKVSKALGDDSVRVAGNKDKTLKKVYVVSGSGGSEYERAKECADAILTGDVRHHTYVEARDDNFTVIEYSHYASEVISGEILKNALKNAGIDAKIAKQSRPFWLLEEI